MPDVLTNSFNPADLSPGASYGVQLANISQVPTSAVDTKESAGLSTMATAGDHFSLHVSNPMFYALVLLLLFVGYVGFMFDFSIKRIGSIGVSGGKK